jgi:hypothetical protein
MTYWVHRIELKTGQLVAENTLTPDVNLFDGPTPNIGDELLVTCRGKTIPAKVVWVRRGLAGRADHVRVQEVSEDDGHTIHPMLPFWGYYINQLRLNDGSLVPADELPQNPCHAPSPEVGDEVVLSCRGKQLKAKVTGIQTADPNSNDKKDRIQVEEI